MHDAGLQVDSLEDVAIYRLITASTKDYFLPKKNNPEATTRLPGYLI